MAFYTLRFRELTSLTHSGFVMWLPVLWFVKSLIWPFAVSAVRGNVMLKLPCANAPG